MRITAIDVIPLSVPTLGRRSALGTFDTFDYELVVVHTDEGIDGYGEVSSLWDGRGPVQRAFIQEYFAPRLVGEDPTAINHCLHLMNTLIEGAWGARAAVEMALFDIAGKASNQPVYQLLGGRTRENIVLSHSIHMQDTEAMARAAAEYVAAGFTCVKVKVGRSSAEDLAAVQAIRTAVGPDILVRVDANMGWRTAKEAAAAIRALEPFDIHSVEQPLPPGDPRDMRLVRESVDTPIMADESVWGPRDAFELLRIGAVDFLNVYVAESGGLTNSALIFRMAEVTGVPCVIGAMPELGVGTAAAVHLGVSMTNLGAPCDASGSMYQKFDIIEQPFRIENGRIWPPEEAGLGISVDWDAVATVRTDR